MKKFLKCISVLCLTAVLAVQVGAAQEFIAAPGDPEYGKPTSFEPVVTADGGAMKNENLSKSAALIPPGFGTPTSYLPGSGEYLTPNLIGYGLAAAGSTINGTSAAVLTPGSDVDASVAAAPGAGSVTQGSGAAAASAASSGFTPVTGDLYYDNKSLGTLKIPSLNVDVKVVQGTDGSALAKGAGHFEDTSIWDGNVAIAGHNRGVNYYFSSIHTLSAGDRITLTTKLGTRNYSVVSVEKIRYTDTAMLAPTTENCITLFTCVKNEASYRWCVRAVEDV